MISEIIMKFIHSRGFNVVSDSYVHDMLIVNRKRNKSKYLGLSGITVENMLSSFYLSTLDRTVLNPSDPLFFSKLDEWLKTIC